MSRSAGQHIGIEEDGAVIGRSSSAEVEPSFYVVMSTQGQLEYTNGRVSEGDLQRYGFDVVRTESKSSHRLYRARNRVALLFSDEADQMEYLRRFECPSPRFPCELLGWWFA